MRGNLSLANNMNKLSFTPFPVLYSERLCLRQLELDDVEEILVLRSDERILKYLIIPVCKNLDEARQFIEKINNAIKQNESLYWSISFKNDKKLIGTICIWNISEEDSRAEIGYALHPDHQQKGIMSEAMDAVLDYAFTIMQLHSIEANVAPLNSASIKLLEKKGFVKEAHFKENIFFNGRFLDTAIYSLLNPNH